MSIPTVQTRVARVLGKLGLRDQVQAVVLTTSHRLVRRGEVAGRSG